MIKESAVLVIAANDAVIYGSIQHKRRQGRETEARNDKQQTRMLKSYPFHRINIRRTSFVMIHHGCTLTATTPAKVANPPTDITSAMMALKGLGTLSPFNIWTPTVPINRPTNSVNQLWNTTNALVRMSKIYDQSAAPS